MPAAPSSRQPGPHPWFSSQAGRLLLEAERAWLAPRLEARPARPRLWCSPTPMIDVNVASVPRELWLHRTAHGYAGSIRCGLPLPLPAECLGDVVLQHPHPGESSALLDEGARLLVDGGCLWLCVFNACSPYRLRARGARMNLALASVWRWELQRRGLQCVGPMRFLGPRWRVRGGGESASAFSLRAACVIQAEKRAVAPVPPSPANWRRGAAPAA